jgi:hypothetical protein
MRSAGLEVLACLMIPLAASACAGTQPATSTESATRTASVEETKATAQVIRSDTSRLTGLRAVPECETPGHPVIRVIWEGSTVSALTSMRIDLTVYPDGFAKGLYVSAPIAEKQTFQPAPGFRALAAPTTALNVVTERVVAERERAAVNIDLARVDPGMLYTIRVPVMTEAGWIGSRSVEVMAPICPSDEVRR